MSRALKAEQFRHGVKKGALDLAKAPCEATGPTELVIAGLDPAIHSIRAQARSVGTEWMPGSSPGMTILGKRSA